jgi:hypothetical protein
MGYDEKPKILAAFDGVLPDSGVFAASGRRAHALPHREKGARPM